MLISTWSMCLIKQRLMCNALSSTFIPRGAESYPFKRRTLSIFEAFTLYNFIIQLMSTIWARAFHISRRSKVDSVHIRYYHHIVRSFNFSCNLLPSPLMVIFLSKKGFISSWFSLKKILKNNLAVFLFNIIRNISLWT
jgi:hypothetical protein